MKAIVKFDLEEINKHTPTHIHTHTHIHTQLHRFIKYKHFHFQILCSNYQTIIVQHFKLNFILIHSF